MVPINIIYVVAAIGAVISALAALAPLLRRSRVEVLLDRARDAKHANAMNQHGLLSVLRDDAEIEVHQALLQHHQGRPSLAVLVQQANLGLTLFDVGLITLICMFVAALVGYLCSLALILWVLLIVVAAALPPAVVVWRRRNRLRAMEAQLPQAFQCLATTLRAGRSLPAAIQEAANGTTDLLQVELQRLVDELELGTPTIDAIDRFEQRIPSDQVAFLAATLRMHDRLGGDVTKAIDMVAAVVRERLQTIGQLQALSAEGRLSGIVLCGLPVVALAGIYYFAPSYVEVLWTDALGKKLLMAAVGLQAVGVFTINRILANSN